MTVYVKSYIIVHEQRPHTPMDRGPDRREEHTMKEPISVSNLTLELDAMTAATQPADAPQEAPAAIIGAIGAPAPAQTITATIIGPDGTPYRATYSADLLDSLRTEARVLDIQDDDTGELVYIKPDPEDTATNEQKEEENTMTTTEREALERINVRQNAATLAPTKATSRKIDRHGLQMHGIRAAAHDTHSAAPYGAYIQISYDPTTGDVLTAYHISVNSWTRYHDPDIIHVTNAHEPMTMQQIADAVAEAVAARC